jgi:DNA-binding transcriptional ArsR family regulator
VSWDVDLSAVGALLAEPARCRIVLALLDGRALPASALAAEAGVAAPTASGHLGRLVEAGWLSVERHGRHRYYRLHGEDVAELVEVAARLAPPEPVRSLRADDRRRQLRRARTCYKHLAGRLGVAVLASMLERDWLDGHDGTFRAESEQLSATSPDVIYRVTGAGSLALGELGVEATPGSGTRHCVDWTEQRHHLSGALGTRLTSRLFDLEWLRRADRGRALFVTPAGTDGFAEVFAIDVQDLDSPPPRSLAGASSPRRT